MNIWIIIVTIYFLGMFFLGTKGCCFCGDHPGNDLLNLLFWFVMYPYNIIKEKRDSSQSKRLNK